MASALQTLTRWPSRRSCPCVMVALGRGQFLRASSAARVCAAPAFSASSSASTLWLPSCANCASRSSSLPAEASWSNALAVASSLETVSSKRLSCGEGVVGAAHARHGFGHLALRHGGVLARHQRGGGPLALFDLALQLHHLLLQLLAGLLRAGDGLLHRGDLLVALGLLGQRLLGEVLVAGVERHAGAVLPLLRLPHVLLILGVQAVVVAHGRWRRPAPPCSTPSSCRPRSA